MEKFITGIAIYTDSQTLQQLTQSLIDLQSLNKYVHSFLKISSFSLVLLNYGYGAVNPNSKTV